MVVLRSTQVREIADCVIAIRARTVLENPPRILGPVEKEAEVLPREELKLVLDFARTGGFAGLKEVLGSKRIGLKGLRRLLTLKEIQSSLEIDLVELGINPYGAPDSDGVYRSYVPRGLHDPVGQAQDGEEDLDQELANLGASPLGGTTRIDRARVISVLHNLRRTSGLVEDLFGLWPRNVSETSLRIAVQLLKFGGLASLRRAINLSEKLGPEKLARLLRLKGEKRAAGLQLTRISPELRDMPMDELLARRARLIEGLAVGG